MKNFNRYENRHGKIWLNIASSSDVLEEYINIENHIVLYFLRVYPFVKWITPRRYWKFFEEYLQATKTGAIVRHDCRKALTFPSNSVDHILCSHFLEHVYPDEIEKIIRDYHRVLKDGATVHVIIPDLEFLVEHYLENKKNKIPQAADEFVKGMLLSREVRGSIKYI